MGSRPPSSSICPMRPARPIRMRRRGRRACEARYVEAARHRGAEVMRIAVALLVVLLCSPARAADDFADVRREIAARHDEAVKRLRDWIALPSIAAEGLNSAEG